MHIPDLVGWKCGVEVEVHRPHGPGVPVPGAVELRVLKVVTSSHQFNSRISLFIRLVPIDCNYSMHNQIKAELETVRLIHDYM